MQSSVWIVLACASAQLHLARPQMLELTEQNFPNYPLRPSRGVEPYDSLKGSWLVMVYLPTCNLCKITMPVYEQLVSIQSKDMNIGRVDCSRMKHLCRLLRTTEYPSFRYSFNSTKGSNWLPYKGALDPNSFMRCLSRVSQPMEHVKQIASLDTFAKLHQRNANAVRVVFDVPDNNDSELEQVMGTVIQLTASLEQLNFYKTEATGSKARALVFNDLPEPQVLCEESWNSSGLVAFVQKNRLLHAVQWVPSMSHIIVNGQLPNLLEVADFAKEHSRRIAVWLHGPECAQTLNEDILSAMREAATKNSALKDGFQFGVLDTTHWQGAGVWTAKFGLGLEDMPVLVVLEENQEVYYLNRTASARMLHGLKDDSTTQIIDVFLSAVLDGSEPMQFGSYLYQMLYMGPAGWAAFISTVLILLASCFWWSVQQPSAEPTPSARAKPIGRSPAKPSPKPRAQAAKPATSPTNGAESAPAEGEAATLPQAAVHDDQPLD